VAKGVTQIGGGVKKPGIGMASLAGDRDRIKDINAEKSGVHNA
jgi:hypothetical protein